MAESRAGSEVPNQPRCGSRDTRAASWESLGRSEVRAEGSGVMPQDCSNVSLRQPRIAQGRRVGELKPKLSFLGVGG